MAKKRSRFRNQLEDAGVRLALWLFRRLSHEKAEAIGRRMGLVARALLPGRRRRAEENISRAFGELPPERVSSLARDVFAHFGGITADLLRTLDEPLDAILSRVSVEGEEIARAAVASGRGVFFLTAHLGNWELGALVTATRGMPMTVIGRPLDNPLLEARLRAFRERSGNTVQPKADAAREILRTLRRGGTIGILTDQHAHPPDAVVVPFFGRPASTNSAVARFIDRTEALVLPTFATRIGPARYRLAFGQPLDPRTLSLEERRPEALTARLNAIVEGVIREYPEQWLWLHNRWRLD
ncbi:MAG TPA: lysophospholipid acyltransferase family protein [Thermoanaerobaculia bacterium]|nr:lysophospholipid acyltransferase family protein [Thermoanaerobaculia bacterium]